MPGKAFCLTALSILLLTAAWQPVQAASFDCSKAEAADEEAVCASRHLNDEDAEMSVLYTQLKPLLGMGSRGDLDEAQVAWLKRRAGCGGQSCLPEQSLFRPDLAAERRLRGTRQTQSILITPATGGGLGSVQPNTSFDARLELQGAHQHLRCILDVLVRAPSALVPARRVVTQATGRSDRRGWGHPQPPQTWPGDALRYGPVYRVQVAEPEPSDPDVSLYS